MNRLKLLPFLERGPWHGQDTAEGSGGPGFVQWARDALRSGLLALLFGLVWAGLSLPASAGTSETLFATQTPGSLNQNDGVSYELGMKFQSDVAGQITAIRYYKATSETVAAGSHVGHIWDSNGNLLATATFVGESAGAGWQQQTLATPLTIQANTTYVVSVNVVSYYVDTVGGLATSVVNVDLSSVTDGQNGVFGTPGLFPTGSYQNSNYFRDIVFSPTLFQCISGQKYVSVNGPGGPFVRNSVTSNNPDTTAANPLIASVPGTNNIPASTVNIPTAFFGGTPVFYQFLITNCGNVNLYNVVFDDCADSRSVGAAGFLQGGANGNCVENPRLVPASRTIATKLAPGASVTVTSATFTQDPISTVDICTTFGQNRTNGIVRNDSQVEAYADLNGNGTGETFVFFDDLNLVQCQTKPASINLLKQISVDGGVTWLDADTAATAPTVVAPSGALYRFIVTNTGQVTLTNVSVSDPTLGLTNVLIPGGTLAAGNSVTITSGTSGFASLSQPGRCTSTTVGNLTNVATVTGTPPSGPNVTDSNPAVLICQAPPPPQCTASSSIASNFNGTLIPAGDYIWFNSNFTASGVKEGTTITLTGSSVQFTSNGTPYTVQVPDAVITFSASVTCATTSFNTSLNRWETTVPLSGSDEIFFSGAAFPVPAGFQKGINPVTWNGTFSTDTPGVSLSWKWGAAAYTQFSTDYNQLGVKPTHTVACAYNNSDHAGTPELFKSSVTGGARGGGGSNFTGSWSGTHSVKPVCP